MNNPMNQKIGRRDLFFSVGMSALAATVSTPLLAAAEKAPKDRTIKRARYQPDSAEVQTFYRVNRYPPKPK